MKTLIILIFGLLTQVSSIQAQIFAAPQANAFAITQHGNRSSPAFADIDLDDDLDLFTGLVSGDFGFFENLGSINLPSFGIFTLGPFNISPIGGNATPFFADLDDDTDFDLLSGGDGGLRYYENLGIASTPSYGPEVQSPFSIISPPGISKPYLVDIDDDNDLDLFVGSTDGNTYYYENTGSVNNPAFAAAVSNPFGIANVGSRSAPAFADLDKDGDFDLLIGNQQGDMQYFENTGTPANAAFESNGLNPFNIQNTGDDAKPYFVDLDDDGDVDLMVGNTFGDYQYFENISPSAIVAHPHNLEVSIYPNPF